MKENVTTTFFTCDFCKKEHKEECKVEIGKYKDSINPFPYDKGWLYLHSLNFKLSTSREDIANLTDKHFCSEECIVSWISREIKRKLKEKEEEKKEVEVKK